MKETWGLNGNNVSFEIELTNPFEMIYTLKFKPSAGVNFHVKLEYKELEQLERLFTEVVEYNPERSAK